MDNTFRAKRFGCNLSGWTAKNLEIQTPCALGAGPCPAGSDHAKHDSLRACLKRKQNWETVCGIGITIFPSATTIFNLLSSTVELYSWSFTIFSVNSGIFWLIKLGNRPTLPLKKDVVIRTFYWLGKAISLTYIQRMA